MKKIIAIICSILMLITIGTPVYAIDGPEDAPAPTEPTNYDPDYYTNNNYHAGGYEARPSDIPMVRRASIYDQAWAGNGVAIYYQDDIPDNVTCSGGTELSEVGCTVTSFAMVIAKYGIYKTPEQVYYSLLNTGGILPDCNMTWNASAVSNAFNGLNMNHWANTEGGWYLESVGMNVIETQIRDYGRPVIVGLHKLSGGTHYVVCYGYEKYSDGGVFHYIYNPQKGQASTLEAYMNSWYIENFTVFFW